MRSMESPSKWIPASTTSEVDHLRTQLMFADVALGVGVLSEGATTWLLLSDDDEPAPVAIGATRPPNRLRSFDFLSTRRVLMGADDR